MTKPVMKYPFAQNGMAPRARMMLSTRHPVGMDAPARQRPYRQPDQRRIDIAGEEIGRALVVRPEQEALQLGGAVADCPR